jgi:hypothetical protein
MAKYINTQTGEYPVTEEEIRAAYPNTSFPAIFVPPEQYKVVFPAPVPPHDPRNEAVRELQPLLTAKGHYEKQYEVYPLR